MQLNNLRSIKTQQVRFSNINDILAGVKPVARSQFLDFHRDRCIPRSGIFRDCILRLIQAYSEPYVTFTYSQPCHIPWTGIFRARGISKTL